MLSLYRDPHFTFRFADARIIARFHLEGVQPGRRIEVFKIDPHSNARLHLMMVATIDEDGWVNLDTPIVVGAGDAFIAVAQDGSPG